MPSNLTISAGLDNTLAVTRALLRDAQADVRNNKIG